MKIQRKYLFIAASIALLLVIGVTLPGVAQMRRHGGHREGANMFFLMRAAQLSDAQKTQVRTIFQNNRATMQQIMTQLVPLRRQLATSLYTTGTADPNLLAQINTLQGQLQQARISVFEQVWSQVLNAGQQKQVATAFSQMQANRAQNESFWKSLKQQPTP
jgi:hypothetical protein